MYNVLNAKVLKKTTIFGGRDALIYIFAPPR